MAYKNKVTTDRSITMFAVAILMVIAGIFLILDDLSFHWMGDLSFLDPSSRFEHWWWGVLLVILSSAPFALSIKE